VNCYEREQIRNKNAKNDDYTMSVEMISSWCPCQSTHCINSFIFMCCIHKIVERHQQWIEFVVISALFGCL
jgi:hypothetical protein